MQNILMKFDPATGKERPYPSHAAEYNEAQEARRAKHDAEMRADAFGPKHG